MPRESSNLNPDGCGPLHDAAGDNAPGLRRKLFDRVRAEGLIPRVTLARDLGVSPATVTAVAADLIEVGLIQEVSTPRGDDDPGRGRPPVALGVRPDRRLAAGINLADHKHSAVIVDFAGRQIARASRASDAFLSGAGKLLDEAEAVLDLALNKAGLERSALCAVGVGLPGVVDHVAGLVAWSPLLRERQVPFQHDLAERLGSPVVIDNDANLVTLAELWFGRGRTRTDFAVITIEHGLGMGLVLNRHLYRGSEGLGMEIAHTKVQLDGALCRCGQRGCLEAYVADYALLREASTAFNLDMRGGTSPQKLLDSLYDRAKSGDQSAQAIFGRAGRYLALGLANVVNLFDPPLILLSGDRLRNDYLYSEDVIAEMSRLIVHTGRPAPAIEIHAWDGFIWARGAAALALEASTEAALTANPAAA